MYKRLLELFIKVGLISSSDNQGQLMNAIVRQSALRHEVDGKMVISKGEDGLAINNGFFIPSEYASKLEIAAVVECLPPELYAANAKDTSVERLKHASSGSTDVFKPTIFINKSMFRDNLEDVMDEYK